MRATGQHEVQNRACCACCRAILQERPTDNDGRRHKSVQHAQTAHEQQDRSALQTQCRRVQNAGEICEQFLEKGPTAFQNELKAFCASATIPPPPSFPSKAALLAISATQKVFPSLPSLA